MEKAERELAVVALLERRGTGGEWLRYRGLYATLMRRYPVVTLVKKSKGRVRSKVVVYLSRHRDIWEQMFELVGWEISKKLELPLEKLVEILDLYEKTRELLEELREKALELPLISEYVRVTELDVVIGGVSMKRIKEFVENVKTRFSEYMAIAGVKVAKETGYVKSVKTSSIYAYAVRGKSKEELRKYIRRALREFLERGIVPVDYTYNYVIIAVKKRRRKGVERYWLSAFGYNPVDVLRGLSAPPAEVILAPERIKRLEFDEKSDIGWGLTVVE